MWLKHRFQPWPEEAACLQKQKRNQCFLNCNCSLKIHSGYFICSSHLPVLLLACQAPFGFYDTGEGRARTPRLLALPATAEPVYPTPSVALPRGRTGTRQFLGRGRPQDSHWVFVLPQISGDGMMKVPGQASDPLLNMLVCPSKGDWVLQTWTVKFLISHLKMPLTPSGSTSEKWVHFLFQGWPPRLYLICLFLTISP